MGTRYRVSVERIDDTPNSEYSTREETLFEVTHHDPTRLARFAPEEVLEALAAAGGILRPIPPAVSDAKRIEGARQEPAVGPGRLIRLPEVSVTAPTSFPIVAATAVTEAPKRTRRTKAQKAADDEAQSLGYRDAAHRAEAGSERHPMATSPEATAVQAASVAHMASAVGADPSPENQAALGAMMPVASGGMPTPQSEAAGVELFGAAAASGMVADVAAVHATTVPPDQPWNPFGSAAE